MSGFRVGTSPRSLVDRLPGYTTRSFLDDQRWVVGRLGLPGPFEDRVEHLDGRYLVIHPGTAHLDVKTAAAIFRERGGPGSRRLRPAAFLATSQFLDEHRAEIIRSGLARRDDPLTVREDLVRFLIARYTHSGGEIPEGALTRFLDEWGHRWV
jgi:hypothetical protein